MTRRISSDLFETIVKNLSQGLYVIQDTQAIFLNDRFGEIFGFASIEPLLFTNMYTEVYPHQETRGIFREIHEQMLANESPQVSWAQPSLKCDGTPFWLEIEARRIVVDGRPAIMGTFKDQTDCQIMAEAMAVSQQTLRRLLDAMEDRVYVVSDDFKILYANRKMLETSNGDPLTDPCYMVCRGEKGPCEECTKDEVFKSGRPMHKEFYSAASQSWYSAIELPIRMPGLDRPAKLAVARDITARKEAEQRIRALSHRLITAQEDERATVSRELHDDLGQRLNAAKICIETLAEDLQEIPLEQRTQVNYLAEILQDSIQSVRRLSAGLRPSALERLGLVETLRNHCKTLKYLHNLNIEFKATGMKDLKLDDDTEINLYRIVQEALNNIVKHAKASEVSVRLIASHPTLRLRITDNGVGFDKNHYATGLCQTSHLGLLGMAERADLLEGSFDIKSQPKHGTKIVLEVPYQKIGGIAAR